MVKSAYPHNEPSRDSSRVQGEAVLGRTVRKSGLVKGDPALKVDRSTRLQVQQLRDNGNPSQPIAGPEPVDTSKVKARRSDLRKSAGQLSAELIEARRAGDEVRATEIVRAQGVLQLGHGYAERVGINEDATI
jgi:hypothetical protein